MTKPNKARVLGALALPFLAAALTGCSGSMPAAPPAQAGLGASGSFQSTARFKFPYGIAVDSASNLYIADSGNNEIRLITPAGKVTTIDGVSSGLEQPVGIAVDSSDNLYVANSDEILQVAPDRSVNVFAGSDNPGVTNGDGSSAHFYNPAGTAVDSKGNIYVADESNNEIRKITAAGEVSTFAGSPRPDFADGTGINAAFNQPFGVAVDSNDYVYVADYGNNAIRKISPAGVVTTFAGTAVPGSADGVGNTSRFNEPAGIAVDQFDNLYVADRGNNKIRMISADGVVKTLAGSNIRGSADGTGAAASFSGPFGIAVDRNQMVYVADTSNNEIRQITLGGVVTTVAGATAAGNHDGTALPRQ
jgi:hypothetical protein